MKESGAGVGAQGVDDRRLASNVCDVDGVCEGTRLVSGAIGMKLVVTPCLLSEILLLGTEGRETTASVPFDTFSAVGFSGLFKRIPRAELLTKLLKSIF